MEIRKAQLHDLDQIMNIYALAREYMAASGNASQWVNGYPREEVLSKDIDSKRLYVCIDAQGDIVAVFYFFVGHDATYDKIEGRWLDDGRYGVVHRIASSGKLKRIADFCLGWCFEQHSNIRVDTHKKNQTMQNVLHRLGYEFCGEIICSDGTPRMAFQKYK